MYLTVKIDGKTWMAENLNYAGQTDGNSSCYDDDLSNCAMYGRQYDWDAAMSACPAGWHLSTNDEWNALRLFADDGTGTSGTKLKAKTGWSQWTCVEWMSESGCIVNNLYSGNGTDNFGFSALPSCFNCRSSWWSATEFGGTDSFYAWYWYMGSELSSMVEGFWDKPEQRNVRCVKDD